MATSTAAASRAITSRPAISQPASAVASAPARSQPATAISATPQRIAELIRNLGSDDIKNRQGAHEELALIGAAAKEALTKAAESSDPEVKGRAQELLDAIAANEALARSQAVAKMLLWSAPVKSGVYGTPVRCGNLVVTFSDDSVHAFAADTGKENWPFEAKAEWRLASSGTTLAVGEENKVSGVDDRTGKLKWIHEAIEGNKLTVMAADDSAIYVNDVSGLLVALSPSDGKPKWKAQTLYCFKPPIPAGKAVIVAGSLYSPDPNRGMPRMIADQLLVCLDADTGKRLWHFDADSPFISLSVGKDAVYLFRQFDMQAIDLKSGDLLWTFKLPETRDPGYFRIYVNNQLPVSPDIGQCRPAVSGDKVYLLFGNSIVGVNAKTGEQVMRHMIAKLFAGDETNWLNRGTIYKPDGMVRTGAAGYLTVDGDIAYFQRNTGLAAIDLKEGKVLWALDLGGTFTGSPLLDGGVLYFGIQEPDKIMSPNGTVMPPLEKSKKIESLNLKPGLHALRVRAEK